MIKPISVALCIAALCSCTNNNNSPVETSSQNADSVSVADTITETITSSAIDSAKLYGIDTIALINKYGYIRQLVYLSDSIYGTHKYAIADIDGNSKAPSRYMLLLQNGVVIQEVNLPTQESFQGFSVNWIRQNKHGFELSVEWGSRYYYDKVFYFRYDKGTFHLKHIKTDGFDKNNTETSWSKRGGNVNPPVSIASFNIEDYM